MTEYRLTVNGDHYIVSSDDDLTLWKTSVDDALHRGGGFINITDSIGVLTALLITPHTTVTLQKTRLPAFGPERSPWIAIHDEFSVFDY